MTMCEPPPGGSIPASQVHDMKVAGLIGWHNSGKTTLVVALVGELAAR